MPQEYRLILKNIDQPGYTNDLDCYLGHGGYETLRKVLALEAKSTAEGKTVSPQEQIRDEVKLSGLRGRGGAGFSCGLKWSFVDRRSGKPIYLICNADESEPGTFKDRQIIHKDPHQMLEGMIIACFANDVHLAYISMPGETGVAQAIAGRGDLLIFGVPSGLMIGLRSGPIAGTPNSTRHMRQLPATGSLG